MYHLVMMTKHCIVLTWEVLNIFVTLVCRVLLVLTKVAVLLVLSQRRRAQGAAC
jgi:hypothetical protein